MAQTKKQNSGEKLTWLHSTNSSNKRTQRTDPWWSLPTNSKKISSDRLNSLCYRPQGITSSEQQVHTVSLRVGWSTSCLIKGWFIHKMYTAPNWRCQPLSTIFVYHCEPCLSIIEHHERLSTHHWLLPAVTLSHPPPYAISVANRLFSHYFFPLRCFWDQLVRDLQKRNYKHHPSNSYCLQLTSINHYEASL